MSLSKDITSFDRSSKKRDLSDQWKEGNSGDELKKIREEKITHMWRRWGTPQNLFLAFIDELEKEIIIKKNCWSGPIKTK